METLTYVELVQNNVTLVRDRNVHTMTKRLQKLGLESIRYSDKIEVVNKITNIQRPFGSVFEGTI